MSVYLSMQGAGAVLTVLFAAAVTALQQTYETPQKTVVSGKKIHQPPKRPTTPVTTVSRDLKQKKALVTPPRADKFAQVLNTATPPKPNAATPPSARAASFLKALRPEVKPAPPGRDVKSLLESVPVAPSIAADWDVHDKDQVPDDWSPRKKKGGHIV